MSEPRAMTTVGILGGGQLARMMALSGAPLGLRFLVLDPVADACAGQFAPMVVGDYTDHAALAEFASRIDVATFDFENVPAETAAFLSARKPVLPDPQVLATTQDRLTEKNFVTGLGIATAPYAAAGSPSELEAAVAAVGRPAVLKTRRFGYDGKGQVSIRDGSDLMAAWRDTGEQPCILEAFVPFEREISVIAARGLDGKVETFEVTENEHHDHILKISQVPARITPAVAAEARRIAATIVTAFAYVGVLAVELFVVPDGAGHAVLVNEIAPRVHNSGHWTIDGCSISQFEQHIRAVAGLPLGEPARRGRRVEMVNLIGAEAEDYRDWLRVPGAAVHLYGKSAIRPGRKMGHVTRVEE